MELTMESATHWNKVLFHDAADARVREWPLLGTPFLTALLGLAWLWLVLRTGPRYMSDRKPFALAGLIQAVNVVQILANAFVTYEFLFAGWLNGYKFACQPCEFTRTPDAMRMARASYIFFLLKIFDMVDTVIYVLRRKTNQITFLHLYHHVTTLILGWVIANYAPGGHATFSQMLNAIVHVIMYSYYFLAALGPQYQKYLWWKKYLTRMQLTQFVVQFLHNVNALRVGCEYPNFIIYLFLPIIVVIFGLFVNFYVQAYRQRGAKQHRQ